MNDNNEKSLQGNIQQSLDEATQNLNMTLQSRLTASRHQALTSRRAKKAFNGYTWPQMGGLAVAVFLALGLFWVPQGSDSAAEDEMLGLQASEMEVLMSTEEFDFLENLEVYEWLDAEYG